MRSGHFQYFPIIVANRLFERILQSFVEIFRLVFDGIILDVQVRGHRREVDILFSSVFDQVVQQFYLYVYVICKASL